MFDFLLIEKPSMDKEKLSKANFNMVSLSDGQLADLAKRIADNLHKTTQVRLLRKPDVCNKTGLPPSTLSDYVAKGLFPKPVKLNPSESQRHALTAWLDSDVTEWILARKRMG